ncbi:MAG: hypothetical protein ACYSR5_06895 [Planctomycetota bacterium]
MFEKKVSFFLFIIYYLLFTIWGRGKTLGEAQGRLVLGLIGFVLGVGAEGGEAGGDFVLVISMIFLFLLED